MWHFGKMFQLFLQKGKFARAQYPRRSKLPKPVATCVWMATYWHLSVQEECVCPREWHSVDVMRERYGATAGVPPCPPVRVDVPDCHPIQQQPCLGHTPKPQSVMSTLCWRTCFCYSRAFSYSLHPSRYQRKFSACIIVDTWLQYLCAINCK